MASESRYVSAEQCSSTPSNSFLASSTQMYAPHLLLERCGVQFSTFDLFGQHYVLLLGADGEVWRAPALRLANQLGIELVVRRIGGDYHDVIGGWTSVFGVSSSGAVLVRPDGGTAWRASTLVLRPEAVLARVLMWCLHA